MANGKAGLARVRKVWLDVVLVAGLLVYVLAAVFDYGAALEDDRSLTV